MTKILRLVLGDQLNSQHSWFAAPNSSVTYLMLEMRQETDYVTHHIQKVVGFFLSMRQFAKELQAQGHQFIYLTLDDPQNQQSLSAQVQALVRKEGFTRFEYLLPDEYRLDQQLQACCADLGIPCQAFDTEHFLSDREYLTNFFKGKKTFLMESFYREMRRKYQVLMEGNQPLTGQWNYDQDNRQALKDKSLILAPRLLPKQAGPIVDLLDRCGVSTVGTIDTEAFVWPTSRKESLELLDHFCEHRIHFAIHSARGEIS